MATGCAPQLDFGFQARTTVRFDGGSLTSDAGLLLVREFDHGFRLTEDLAGAYEDPRRADRIEHPSLALLRQRIVNFIANNSQAGTVQAVEPNVWKVSVARARQVAWPST